MNGAHAAPHHAGVLMVLGVCALLCGCRVEEAAPPAAAPASGPELPHAGSGVIVSDRGHVLTHASVVENAKSIAVEISRQDRRERAPAEIVATDPATGLVLLKTGAVSRWAMRWRQAGRPETATACGWPVIGLAAGGTHEREMTAATGPIDDERVEFPLAPGFDGGVLADENARGVGIIAGVTAPAHRSSGNTQASGSAASLETSALQAPLAGRPAYIPATAVLRFLGEHGVAPPAERADFDRPWRTKLGWLLNSTAQIQRTPPRPTEAAMPRLVASHRIEADDVTTVRFARDGARLVVRCWKAPNRAFAAVVEVPHGDAGIEHDPMPPPYRRDRLGNLFELEADGTVGRNLAAINGLRGFNARGPLETDAYGRLLLAGDALIWRPTGTVIIRLDARADDALALSPDGRLIAHAPARSPGTVRLWRLPDITP